MELNWTSRAMLRCSVLIASMLACGDIALAQTPEGDLKSFPNSLVPLPPPEGPGTNVAVPTSQTMNRILNLHFSLASKNLTDLEVLVAKGETISSSELNGKFAGSPEDAQKLAGWLKARGFKILQITPDNTSVYATATAAQVADSLQVKMASLTHDGVQTITATTPPKLPREIAASVVAIDGLQPWIRAQTHVEPREQYQKKIGGVVPRSAAVTARPYMVSNLLDAYKVKGLGTTGKGQTIAILIDTLPLMSDLKSFWSRNSLHTQPSQIKLINVKGNGARLPTREGEETLDAEWASGIAPGATIAVYAAGSLQYTDLDRALDQIRVDAGKPGGARQVSISLGLREDLVSPDEISSEHASFLKLAALGVTVFAASGDAGSNPDSTGHSRGNDVVVEYEASDNFVVAVGGTTLAMDTTAGNVKTEVGWSDSGGGVSKQCPKPQWQDSYTDITSQMRLVPDVSAVADPEPGALVILNGKDWPVGGTSWSTPVWAAFSALLAEERAVSRKPPMGFLGPKLYGAAARHSFREITVGSNGAYRAGPGWNPVTGLGVPDVTSLAATLQ